MTTTIHQDAQGATWSQAGPDVYVCRKVKEMGPFWYQGNEMNEKFSFKMGVRFAALLDMGKKNLLDILYKFMFRNASTELQLI